MRIAAAPLALLALLALAWATQGAEIDSTDRAILHNHIKTLKLTGEHDKPHVPEHVRGVNMTVENLHRWLNAEMVHQEIRDPEGNVVDPSELGADAKAEIEAAAQPAAVAVARRALRQTGHPEVDTIIAVGKEVWQFIEDNKPVTNYDVTAQMSAIPKACEDDWLSMAGFKSHTSYDVVWTFINGFNQEVVKVVFAWTWKAEGACMVDGKSYGKYIKDAGIAAKSLKCAWGYTCEAQGKAFSPYNEGTHSDPIAAMDLQVDENHRTVLKETHSQCRVTLSGSGKGKSVNCLNYPRFRLKY